MSRDSERREFDDPTWHHLRDRQTMTDPKPLPMTERWREVSREELVAARSAAKRLVHDCNAIFEPPIDFYWDEETAHQHDDWAWGREAFGRIQRGYAPNDPERYYLSTDESLIPKGHSR